MPSIRERPSDLALVGAATMATSATGAVVLLALALRLSTLGSAWAVSGLWLSVTVPAVLLAPATGLLLDRFETVGVLRRLALLGAAVDLGLALAPGVGPVLALALILGVIAATSAPGMLAIAGSLAGSGVGDAPRQAGTLTWIQASQWTGATVGTVVGAGLVAAWGTRVPLLIDAAALFLLAGGLGLVRARRRPGRRPTGSGRRRELGAGVRLLLGDRLMRSIVPPVAVVICLVNAAVVVEVFLATRTFESGAVGYGALVAIWGIGLVLGTLAVPRLRPSAPLMVTGLGAALAALGLVGAGVSPWLALACAAYLLGGFGNGLEMNSVRILVQRRANSATQGRAFAAYYAVGSAAAAAGAALGGLLQTTAGPRGAMLVAALPVAVAAGWLLWISRTHPCAGQRGRPPAGDRGRVGGGARAAPGRPARGGAECCRPRGSS